MLEKYELSSYGIDPQSVEAITMDERGYVISFESEGLSKEQVDQLGNLLSEVESEIGVVEINMGATQQEVKEKAKEEKPVETPAKAAANKLNTPKEQYYEFKFEGPEGGEKVVETDDTNRERALKRVQKDVGEQYKLKSSRRVKKAKRLVLASDPMAFARNIWDSWMRAGREITESIYNAIKRWLGQFRDEFFNLTHAIESLFGDVNDDPTEVLHAVNQALNNETFVNKEEMGQAQDEKFIPSTASVDKDAMDSKSSEIEKEVEVDISKDDEVSEKNIVEEIESEEIKTDELKSQIWEESAKEVLNEAIDLDEATSDFYEKIVEKLSDALEDDQISEDEYKKLIKELDELKDKDILTEDLLARIEELAENENIENEKTKEEKMEDSNEKMIQPTEPRGIDPQQQSIELPSI